MLMLLSRMTIACRGCRLETAASLADVGSVSWYTYLLVPLVAAAATMVGIVFHKTTLGLRAKRKQFERIPPWSRPAIGAFITWVLGSMIFLKTGHLGVFGLGYEDLSAAMTHQLPKYRTLLRAQ